MNHNCLFLLVSLFLFSCTNKIYEETHNGVIINLNQDHSSDVKKIRLQLINDKIIHVSATPENHFSDEASLIIIPQSKDKVPFFIEETDSFLILKTNALNVSVSITTGEILFTDLQGQTLLCENQGGGKSFIPIKVEDTRGYTLHQVFESPDNEAFYGLGQHQSDEFNYKGKNEALFQYNTKISVPFIISNKNYGILWDNYSLSRFGDTRDYSQLNELFTLYDQSGKAGGLTATYTPSDTIKNSKIIRTEDSIFYEDIKTIKNLPENFRLNNSHVTYQGEIEARENGTYYFHLYYAGYVKIYAGDQLIVPERWRTAWNPNSYKFSLELKAGERLPLLIDWKPDGGTSYLGLRAQLPVSQKEQNKLSFFSEMGNEIDYYFIYGNDMDDVISGYRTLTGKSPIMPKWAMGFWQSRERYKTQEEILSTLKEFRRRQIPVDNIVLDWSYWPEDAWGSHEFDKTRFSDPKGMVDSIHIMNAQMMISVWPKFYLTTEHFKEFDQNGWIYKRAIEDSIRDWIGPGYIASFYDAYSDDAKKLFWQQMREHLYPLGIDAWWMDASEPNIRDCTDMDYRKALCGPTALGPSTKYFNAYALMNAQAIYEGLREEDPDRRVFQLTRSGFAGLQRYATASWSGDIATRWEDLKAQISAGLNFSVSGIPYWTHDIGGFCVEKRYEKAYRLFNSTGEENEDMKEWRELNTRWHQFGAFSPLFRSHGQYPPREVYNIAPENHPAYRSMVYFTKLRYNLLPYIYSLAGMTYHNDYTIMRPLVMDFVNDRNVNNIGDQYMFGPSIMVCPVYEYQARKRDIYFPATTGWYDFYSGKHIEGGQALAQSAPYEQIPLYIREGAIIPYGPDIQHYNEKKPEEITIYVYAGKNGSFNLYEDEDVNYNYEKGKYIIIPFSYDESSRSLLIGERKGDFPGMLQKRKFNVILVDKDTAVSFASNGHKKGISVDYDGQKQVVKF